MQETTYVLMLPFSDKRRADEIWKLLNHMGFGVVGIIMRREVIPVEVQEVMENVL